MAASKIDTLFNKMGFLKETSLPQIVKVTSFTRQQVHNMMHTLIKEKAVEKRKKGRLVWYTRIKKTRREEKPHREIKKSDAMPVIKSGNDWDVQTPPPHTGKRVEKRINDNLNGKHSKTDSALAAAFRDAVKTEPEQKPEKDAISKKEVLAACETILNAVVTIDTFVQEQNPERIAALEKENLELAQRLAKIEKNLKKMLNGEGKD